ncbi:DinB family protein [Mechercharimyces sp. CAU 1602]|uniref:DinB family protein n=1 Tax=Mechercharimyces sp. CAU 1602 TaxID=2973933 RepID=UPI0021637938|nr:DinB family protein [Mechercharimyces sp. CAU 1602]MCS1351483.1 DinB family protein [Mechercharimyces sp. CAU 1602]
MVIGNENSEQSLSTGGINMFYKVEDFLLEWRREFHRTASVLKRLTDESLTQQVAPLHWSLGDIAWHLPYTMHEMLTPTGLKIDFVDSPHDLPHTASNILDTYLKTAQSVYDAVKNTWDDHSLSHTSSPYGEKWPHALTLRILIQHEIHHRGQVLILMRQAGLRVPGLYGSVREDFHSIHPRE